MLAPTAQAVKQATASQPAANVIRYQWSASSGQTAGASVASPAAAKAASPTSVTAASVAARYGGLTADAEGLAADGTPLSAEHAVTSSATLAAVGAAADRFLAANAAGLGQRQEQPRAIAQALDLDRKTVRTCLAQAAWNRASPATR